MSAIRVLVVEDFAPFLQVIRSVLAERPDLQVIGEVADAWKGFRKRNYWSRIWSSLTSDSPH
jgi:chemotaxis response regulator CheB